MSHPNPKHFFFWFFKHGGWGGGWGGVTRTLMSQKVTPLLTLPQRPPNRYNFESSKATLPLFLEIFLFSLKQRKKFVTFSSNTGEKCLNACSFNHKCKSIFLGLVFLCIAKMAPFNKSFPNPTTPLLSETDPCPTYPKTHPPPDRRNVDPSSSPGSPEQLEGRRGRII